MNSSPVQNHRVVGLRTSWLVLHTAVWTVLVAGVGVLLPVILATSAGVLPQLLRASIGWRLIGLLPMSFAVGLYLWAASTFIAIGHGTPNPLDSPRLVVAQGPYRFVRNPMYIAVALFLSGEFIVLGDISVLLYCAAAIAVMAFFAVAIEEPMLEDRFGETYEDYRRRVPGWIPRVTRS